MTRFTPPSEEIRATSALPGPAVAEASAISTRMDLELRRSRMKAWMPPLNRILPEWITTRLVQSDSTSESMWEDITIVPPSLTKSLKIDRNWTTPAGSIPIMGSSRMSTFGEPIRA